MARSADRNNFNSARATCLNCMDGRVQLPVLNWIRKRYAVQFVDVITRAGMDGALALSDDIGEIVRSVDISVKINGSSRIFVAGHHDCRGNPADSKTHRRHIMKAVRRLKRLRQGLEVIGLWVNSRWQVEVCRG